MSDYRVVLCTCPESAATGLAHTLVAEAQVAACVNIVPGITSVYRWEGETHTDVESLLLIKTTTPTVERLTEVLLAVHPYDVPEIIALPIKGGEGNPAYLTWLASRVAVGGALQKGS